MVKLFQKMFNLDVTGKLDNNTVELMVSPRCGVPDFLTKNDQPMVKTDPSAPASYVASIYFHLS